MNIHQTIRKLLITMLIIMIMVSAKAQVYIQTTIPPAGLVQKNQLWNLVLVNGFTGPVEGRLSLILRNRQQNTELMTATTGRFSIPRGSLPVNVNNLGVIQYNWLGMDPNTLMNGLLPAGAYTACYSFARRVGEQQEQISEECVPFDVEPLSPPMLIFPADSSALEISPAQFTWAPPTPAGMISRLHYDVYITEIRPGQKAAEAIQDNMPFYNAAQVTNSFITYPAALPAFEKEKWYSWQVVARDDKSYAGKSEIWVFKIKKEDPLTAIVQRIPYLKMKPEASDVGIAPNGMLKISFFNRGIDSVAQVWVTNLSAGGKGDQQVAFTIKIKPGENQAMLDLKKKMGLSEEHTYKAGITYSWGERNSVLFRVKYFNEKEEHNN